MGGPTREQQNCILMFVFVACQRVKPSSVASKPHLLFLTPVTPADTGSGLAMRAGIVVRALADWYRISLLIVPFYDGRPREAPAAIARLCHQTVVLPLDPGGQTPSVASLLQGQDEGEGSASSFWRAAIEKAQCALQNLSFDVIHVFRLVMVPFAEPYLSSSRRRSMKCHLDLDIIESKTRRRLAELYRATGKSTEARVEALLARRFEALEEEAFARFDRVYVCSEQDKEELQGRSRAKVSVLPNAVHAPGPVPPTAVEGPFAFMFIGTLSYYPNEDALNYFCEDIAPLIRQAAPGDFRLHVVGRGMSDATRRLSQVPEVRILGEAAEVAPLYRDADAVIVPLRAAGGTRIKILEAFSYRCPVVTTSIGLEGIEARDAEHVLVADTAQTFASHCLHLMTDRGSAERMAERAFALFMGAYSVHAVERDTQPQPE